MLITTGTSQTRAWGLRAGYSLVELMVAIVILGIVAGAATRMLTQQTRFFDRRANVGDARAVTQSALNVMESELRMVQDTLGVAAVAADGSSITVRAPYLVGVVCVAGAGATTVLMTPADSSVYNSAVFGGYAYRNANKVFGSTNYVSTAAGASAVASSNASCISSTGLKSYTVAGRSVLKYDVTPVVPAAAVGDAVMFWQLIKYEFKNSTAYPGYLGLYRSAGTNAAEELLAPFKTGSKFQFYLGPNAGAVASSTSQAVAASDTNRIKGVDIILIGASQKKLAGSDTTAASKNTTAVFFHNHWQ